MADSGTSRYGNNYFCILVPKTVARDGEIYLMADSVTVSPDGSLIASRKGTKAKTGMVSLALAPSKWIGFYAASLIDGHAVAVESWNQP